MNATAPSPPVTMLQAGNPLAEPVPQTVIGPQGRKQLSAWATSFVLHAWLVVALALWSLATLRDQPPLTLTMGPLDESLDPPVENEVRDQQDAAFEVATVPAGVTALEVHLSDPAASDDTGLEDSPAPHASALLPMEVLLAGVGSPVRGGLTGRGEDARSRLVMEEGGSSESEAAVRLGLAWLAAHQRPDGSWNFNHHKSRCQGLCRHPGKVPSSTGATAIALLPFLGAGQTHQEGEYRQLVARGLYALMNRARSTPDGMDLQEGTMYAHGLSAIVLAEAYAMTQDEALKPVAQGALDFIVAAQDPQGGGWRYRPGQPGDTSMHGWQWMALKSGQMAYLKVPYRTLLDADQFLDRVQTRDGARYGYQTPGDGPATSAIGLLCRMYHGWHRDRPALVSGVERLAELGPSDDNLYYNYYATQVLHHWGGDLWRGWNPRMRDHLIATQSHSGHESGSWYFTGGHGAEGGRLYNTAMAVMTLEVYYRHLPIYRRQAVGQFEEDEGRVDRAHNRRKR